MRNSILLSLTFSCIFNTALWATGSNDRIKAFEKSVYETMLKNGHIPTATDMDLVKSALNKEIPPAEFNDEQKQRVEAKTRQLCQEILSLESTIDFDIEHITTSAKIASAHEILLQKIPSLSGIERKSKTPAQLAKIEAFKKAQVINPVPAAKAKQKWIELSAENREYFKIQRANLRNAYNAINDTLVEAEVPLRAQFLTRLSGYNSLITGGAGAAKTLISILVAGISKEVFNEHEDIVTLPEPYIVQINSLTSDAIVKGHVDAQQILISLAQKTVGKDDQKLIFNLGTMLHRRVVVADEIDKMGPQFASALFDLLNPTERRAYYGVATTKANTQSIFLTANQPYYDMLSTFKATGMAGTIVPFLDRIQYKMLMANKFVLTENRRAYYMARGNGHRTKLQELWAQADVSRGELISAMGEINALTKKFPVDFEFLRNLAPLPTTVTPNVPDKVAHELAALLEEVVGTTTHELQNQAKSYAQQKATNPNIPEFSPANEYNNRNLDPHLKTIAYSLLLDLLLLPEQQMSTETLMSYIEKGLPFDAYSIWRVHNFLLQTGPGGGELTFEDINGTKPPLMSFGSDEVKILQHSANPTENWGYTFLENARQSFSTAYTDKLRGHTQLIKDTADIYAKITALLNPGGTQNQATSLEHQLWLYKKGAFEANKKKVAEELKKLTGTP